jgi:3',5'-cyclic AMP phosphodiesterase CpdA
MSTTARFLHLTDPHLTGSGEPLKRDDHKTHIPGIDQATREGALDVVLQRLAERLLADGVSLDAVVFTGDATLRGVDAGQRALLDMLLQRLGSVGITAGKIVATPGNHDVPKGTAPGSQERYQVFLDVWRAAGCVTPWLDGIDPPNTSHGERHRLLGPEGNWAIFPINSANWSHVSETLRSPLKEVWSELHVPWEAADPDKAKQIREQLDALVQHDMARVSEAQLEELRRIVGGTPVPEAGQVRIVALHHHLSAPSLREEVKGFADFTNLQLLRRSLRERNVQVVMHGHKHDFVAQFDSIYGEDGANGGEPHRALVLSGATFGAGQESDSARLVTLNGLPYVPELTTSPLGLLRGGTELVLKADKPLRLWASPAMPNAPIVIQGSDFDAIYHQACSVATQDAAGGTLIVHVDFKPDEPIRLPVGYSLPENMNEGERKAWFDDLVKWWQLERSRLTERVPYLHGVRLHRFGGAIDQVDRIRDMLADKASSRALATLVDPARDFKPKGKNESFASFCLVQFRRRGPEDNASVDVVGYYRAQEFASWWPINVAELRSLQMRVLRGTKLVPGRVTTITTEARSSGKSPTQVAMPVIDRWLDQHPERLYILANCLLGNPSGTDLDEQVKRQWWQTLDDLEAASSEFNPDGVPVPIDGLAVLAGYLAATEPQGNAREFLKTLNSLIKMNREFAAKQTSEAFDAWGARGVSGDLRSLARLCLKLRHKSHRTQGQLMALGVLISAVLGV